MVSQVAKSENNASGSDTAETLAEDLLKRFTDTKPEIKKEPGAGQYFIQATRDEVVFMIISILLIISDRILN